MNTVFVLCEADPASQNVGRKLEKKGNFEFESAASGKHLYTSGRAYMVTIDSIHIHREGLDAEIEKDFGVRPDRIVFMSTHRSESNTPAITFHPIGNYGEAKLGGRVRALVPSCPELMTGFLLSMDATPHHGYQVTFEATHHGPALSTPAMFAEIGSDESAWRDGAAGNAVAEVLLGMKESEGTNAIGIGGGHYCSRFKEITQKRNINFGHFIPNHNLHLVDETLAAEVAEKSPRTAFFAVHEDKKHAAEIERVAGLLEGAGLKRLAHSEVGFRK